MKILLLLLLLVIPICCQVHSESDANSLTGMGQNTIQNCKVSIIGAGVGGLYSAFRLSNSSLYNASDICVFEKTGRVGGRALTVGGVFPTKSTVDVGAHRYTMPEHQMTDSIVKKVLHLHTSCFSRTADCVDDQPSFYFLRNNYTGELRKSRKLPYFFNENEQWEQKKDMPDPFGDIFEMYPFILEAFEDLTSPDPSIRYPAIKNTLQTLRNYKVNGLYPNQIDARSVLANYSSELWQFLLDIEGESSYILHVNLYDLLREAIYYAIDEVQGDIKIIITDESGNEIGYDSISKGLEALLVGQGMQMYYHKEAVSVYHNQNGSLTINFADGTSANSEKAIFNIPQVEFMRLSHDSIVFTAASKNVKKAYNLFTGVPAVKAYLYYPDAWWYTVLNMTKGEVATTENVRFFEYADGNIECENSTCKGFVLVSYPDGEYYNYFETARKNHAKPLLIIRSNTTDKVKLKWFNDLSNSFLKSQQGIFEKAGINPDTLPKPEILAMGIWDQAWYYLPVSKFKGGDLNEMMLNPVPGVPVYLANEAWSIDQGWAEGSLIASEKIMKNYFNLPRPSWLGNQYWYDAIIAYNTP